MKQIVLLFFVIVSNCLFALGQNTADNRVKEIRTMYTEVNNLHSMKREFSCKSGSRGKKANIDFEGKNTYARANECYYPNNYHKITSVTEGWEWNSTGEYYFKNGNLFFAYVVNNDLCDRSEYRFYYYPNGTVARILEKTSSCLNSSDSKNREVSNSYKINELLRMSNSDLRDAMNIIR